MKTIVFVALFALFAMAMAAEPKAETSKDLEAAPAIGLGYGLHHHGLLHHGLLHHGLLHHGLLHHGLYGGFGRFGFYG